MTTKKWLLLGVAVLWTTLVAFMKAVDEVETARHGVGLRAT